MIKRPAPYSVRGAVGSGGGIVDGGGALGGGDEVGGRPAYGDRVEDAPTDVSKTLAPTSAFGMFLSLC